MAVFKHKHGKTFTYNFTVENGLGVRERFRGSTGETTERAALKVEARLRAEVEAKIANRPLVRVSRLPDMRLREATARYWTEKVQFEKNADTAFGQLSRLVDRLGPDTLLSAITTNELTRYQSSRRTDGVANKTINEEVPGLLSRVYKRAKLWKVDLGDEIDWTALKLPIPRHRTRAASRREEVLLLRNLRHDYRPIIRFALMTGLRRSAFLLRKDQVDFETMTIQYDKKSKHTGDKGWLPITAAMCRNLQTQIALSPDDCPYVFTYLCRRGRGSRKKGQRYAITKYSLREAVEPAVAAAGLKDWRLIHDLRHTAATNILRSSQNLAAVQGMLGHSDIAQTARYAHVLMDDVRRAMEGSR